LSEFARIESLLLENEERLQNDPAVHANWKHDAIDRLVRLYEVWNGVAPGADKAGKATQWRLKLASFDRAEAEKKVTASKAKSAAQ
jgi:hypothetical protein